MDASSGWQCTDAVICVVGSVFCSQHVLHRGRGVADRRQASVESVAREFSLDGSAIPGSRGAGGSDSALRRAAGLAMAAAVGAGRVPHLQLLPALPGQTETAV